MGVSEHTQQGAWPGESRGCILGRVALITVDSYPAGAWIAGQNHFTFSIGNVAFKLFSPILENNARKRMIKKDYVVGI